MQNQNKIRGFTLLEMLLSIAVIGLITGIGIPIYQSFQVRNDLDIAVSTVTQSLRRAQALSRAVDGDMSWGVKVQSGNIVVFKGVSYTARDGAFDETSVVQTSITPSGISEIVFVKFTGLPQATGTITFTSNANETRNITINKKGTISF